MKNVIVAWLMFESIAVFAEPKLVCHVAFRCERENQPKGGFIPFYQRLSEVEESRCETSSAEYLNGILSERSACGPRGVPKAAYAAMVQPTSPAALPSPGPHSECSEIVRCYSGDLPQGWYMKSPQRYQFVSVSWITTRGKCSEVDRQSAEMSGISHRACREATGSSIATAQANPFAPAMLGVHERPVGEDSSALVAHRGAGKAAGGSH